MRNVTNVKECRMSITDKAKVRCGTTDNTSPQVVYVSYMSWMTPVNESCSTAATNAMLKEFKKQVYEIISSSEDFDSKIMLDYDVKWNILGENKPAKLPIDIFFKQKAHKVKNLREARNVLQELLREPVLQLIDNLKCIGICASLSKKNLK